jgi:hypothetical protein
MALPNINAILRIVALVRSFHERVGRLLDDLDGTRTVRRKRRTLRLVKPKRTVRKKVKKAPAAE